MRALVQLLGDVPRLLHAGTALFDLLLVASGDQQPVCPQSAPSACRWRKQAAKNIKGRLGTGRFVFLVSDSSLPDSGFPKPARNLETTIFQYKRQHYQHGKQPQPRPRRPEKEPKPQEKWRQVLCSRHEEVELRPNHRWSILHGPTSPPARTAGSLQEDWRQDVSPTNALNDTSDTDSCVVAAALMSRATFLQRRTQTVKLVKFRYVLSECRASERLRLILTGSRCREQRRIPGHCWHRHSSSELGVGL